MTIISEQGSSLDIVNTIPAVILFTQFRYLCLNITDFFYANKYFVHFSHFHVYNP